jgi:hypothetical protein
MMMFPQVDVLIDGCLGSYDALLAAFRTHTVGVMAPLPFLEEREAGEVIA